MTVYLVGAGPGDPDLLTVRAAQLIERADVILHDRLVSPAVLALAAPTCCLVDVGKSLGHGQTQADINNLLVDLGRRQGRVVRLKGGDPFVFGRGGEEALALATAGIEVEVVPGVSSAIAAPAMAGVPVTHRGVATHVTIVTGHTDAQTNAVDWAAIAQAGGTIVVLMGVGTRRTMVKGLVAGGMTAATPVCVIESATLPGQRVQRTTLGLLCDLRFNAPATIVVGDVSALDVLAVTAAQAASQKWATKCRPASPGYVSQSPRIAGVTSKSSYWSTWVPRWLPARSCVSRRRPHRYFAATPRN